LHGGEGVRRESQEASGHLFSVASDVPSGLAWIFHTAHEMSSGCSRRRKEADRLERALPPPPNVGGYDGYEISRLEGRRPAAWIHHEMCHAEGVPDISRGLRSAKRDDTPGNRSVIYCTPTGCGNRPLQPRPGIPLRDLSRVVVPRSLYRGFSLALRPPANVHQPAGLNHPENS
jgi:hypothetical protein